LLVQEVAAQFTGKVTFVSENFGASKLAERHGVKGYPAVFVDGVLVASPREFGYFGEKEGTGRYAPWRSEASQKKFKADLARMIELILAGRKDVVSQEHPDSAAQAQEIAALPKFTLADLSGKAIKPGDLAGRVVLVEFWATWCPPCRSTLSWLDSLKKKYGDRLAVVALAVESPEAEIRQTVSSIGGDLRWAVADAPSAEAFGDITAVPTMFLFDRSGKTAQVLYGAPPDLHEQVGKVLDRLVRE
jgi:cytochrome c biogenesis protein CcmG, thiol:disulfide interchange protein DsbE